MLGMHELVRADFFGVHALQTTRYILAPAPLARPDPRWLTPLCTSNPPSDACDQTISSRLLHLHHLPDNPS